MRRDSVLSRNLQAALIIFTLFFTVFGALTIGTGRWMLIREKHKSLSSNADEIREFAESVQYDNGLRNLSLRMDLIFVSRCTGNHIFLCDADGEIVSSSDTIDDNSFVGQSLGADVMEQLRTDGSYQGITDLGGLYDGRYYVVAEEITGLRDDVMGYVFVGYPAENLLGGWSSFSMVFMMVGVVMILLVIFCEYANTRRLSGPLREMAEAANRFGHGDYTARVEADHGGREANDELTTLTNAFNSMAESLEQTESRRRAFVANVSHELRTPMTTIAGFADGLLDGTIPPEEEKKYLRIISSETKRLSRLVRSMLDMSRLQDGASALREQSFDLCEMVVRTVLSLEERFNSRGLDLELNLPEDPVMAHGDVDSLTRVVYNLTDNAVKFANEGSKIVISVWRENDRVYTSVQDVGEVIPPEELDRIFDRFHKADSSRSEHKEGVGLGLYMVREIIAAHEQDIFVTSEDGVTTFTFTLAEAV